VHWPSLPWLAEGLPTYQPTNPGPTFAFELWLYPMAVPYGCTLWLYPMALAYASRVGQEVNKNTNGGKRQQASVHFVLTSALKSQRQELLF